MPLRASNCLKAVQIRLGHPVEPVPLQSAKLRAESFAGVELSSGYA
jgi:hypothetical protein